MPVGRRFRQQLRGLLTMLRRRRADPDGTDIRMTRPRSGHQLMVTSIHLIPKPSNVTHATYAKNAKKYGTNATDVGGNHA